MAAVALACPSPLAMRDLLQQSPARVTLSFPLPCAPSYLWILSLTQLQKVLFSCSSSSHEAGMLVIFLADSSCTGKSPSIRPMSQQLG